MGAVTLQRERFVDAIDEALPILRREHAELSPFRDVPMEIDRAGYAQAEALGLLRVYTARVDHALAGYTSMIVGPNLHHASARTALQDVFYVDPRHRGRLLGLMLLRFADEQLQAEGVTIVMRSSMNASPDMGRLLRLHGYSPDETLWFRRLDRIEQRARMEA